MDRTFVAGVMCDHVDQEPLGYDGPAAFSRCRACGAIFVEQTGRLWVIRPATK